MKLLFSRKLLGAAALTLLLLFTVSPEALGQGRGRGRGRGGFDDRKCGKFVNCHDARDGRWDGRGPRRDLSLTDRIFRRSRRTRDRDWDNNRRHWRRYRNHRIRR